MKGTHLFQKKSNIWRHFVNLGVVCIFNWSRELVVFSNVSTTHSWPPKSPITTTVPHNFQLSTQQHNFFNQSSSTWSKQAFGKQNTGYKATKKQEEHLPYQKFSIWSKNNYMGVSKNRGKTPKMDGENNGKPLSKWNDLEENPLFLVTSISSAMPGPNLCGNRLVNVFHHGRTAPSGKLTWQLGGKSHPFEDVSYIQILYIQYDSCLKVGIFCL